MIRRVTALATELPYLLFAAQRRNDWQQRRPGGGPCQGRQPPKAGAIASLYRARPARPTLGRRHRRAIRRPFLQSKPPQKITRGARKKHLQKGGESGSRPLYAGRRLPSHQAPDRLVPEEIDASGFDDIRVFSTRHRRVCFRSSPGRTPARGHAPNFCSNAHDHGFWPQPLGMVWDPLLKADPEGPTLIFHAAVRHGFISCCCPPFLSCLSAAHSISRPRKRLASAFHPR